MRFSLAFIGVSTAVTLALSPSLTDGFGGHCAYAAPGGGGIANPFARTPWLGVSMQPTPDGVLAAQVVPGSPAEKAGVRVGDHLKRVAGSPVTQPSDVQRAVTAHGVGDRIALVVERATREITMMIELEERPAADAVARASFVGKPAPKLVGLVTVNGPALTTEALKNRVVIVDFWAVWCGPCRMSMPMLSALQTKYGAQGLTVVSITNDPVDRAAALARNLQLRTTVAVDKEGTTESLYGVSVLPTTFVIDRRGTVRDVALGYDTSLDAHLETMVRDLLQEQQEKNGSAADAGLPDPKKVPDKPPPPPAAPGAPAGSGSRSSSLGASPASIRVGGPPSSSEPPDQPDQPDQTPYRSDAVAFGSSGGAALFIGLPVRGHSARIAPALLVGWSYPAISIPEAAFAGGIGVAAASPSRAK